MTAPRITADAPVAEADGLKRSAREMLLDAAERLFGQRGIDGVSLREIAAAAGQRNNSAVIYHFQDKQGLIDTLIADRVSKIEKLRQSLLDKVENLATCDSAQLLAMMWQPMLDPSANRGGHWFIQFHLSYHLSLHAPAPVQKVGTLHPIVSEPARFPASRRLLEALQARNRHLPAEQFRYRLGLLFLTFWAAAAQHGNATVAAQSASITFSLEEIVKMAVAALEAPA